MRSSVVEITYIVRYSMPIMRGYRFIDVCENPDYR